MVPPMIAFSGTRRRDVGGLELRTLNRRLCFLGKGMSLTHCENQVVQNFSALLDIERRVAWTPAVCCRADTRSVVSCKA